MTKRPFSVFFMYVILEIASFIAVGKWIGFGWAILAIIGCSVLGFLLLKIVSAGALTQMLNVSQTSRVKMKPAPILNPLAAILVIIPGFISTILGLLLFLPFVQNWCLAHFKIKASAGANRFFFYNFQSSTQNDDQYNDQSFDQNKAQPQQSNKIIDDDVIEGEFENKD